MRKGLLLGLVAISISLTSVTVFTDVFGESKELMYYDSNSPYVELSKYENSEYGFSFYFPKNWEHVILNQREPGMNYISELYDSESNIIQVMYLFDDIPVPFTGTDTQLINQLMMGINLACPNFSMERDGMLCLKANKVGGDVFNINGVKVIRLDYSMDVDYGDGYTYQIFSRSDTFVIDTYHTLTFQKLVPEKKYLISNYYENLIKSVEINKKDIPKNSNSQSLSNSVTSYNKNIYVNDDYGLTVSPPEGWTFEEFTIKLDSSNLEGLKYDTFFVAVEPTENSFSIPTAIMFGAKLPEFSIDDFGSQQDVEKELFRGMTSVVESMENSISKKMETEIGTPITSEITIVDSEMISFGSTTHLKAYFDMLLKSDSNILSNSRTRIDMWMSESGQAVIYFLNSEKSTFLQHENSFQKSVDSFKLKPEIAVFQTKTDNGGGCLIATATFDSELAPQVQKLREIRDSKLLQTESGSQFMEHFNSFYYSFSPIIADYERENPLFKEIVKIGITPMISTLSLMDYADTESEVLGIGISLIILNAMMYVGLPVFGIVIAKKRF